MVLVWQTMHDSPSFFPAKLSRYMIYDSFLHFIKDPPHKYFEAPSIILFNQYSQIDVSYSAYIEVKFCSYNPSSNFNFYLWNGVLLPYSGIFSRTISFAVFVDFTATSKINPRKS